MAVEDGGNISVGALTTVCDDSRHNISVGVFTTVRDDFRYSSFAGGERRRSVTPNHGRTMGGGECQPKAPVVMLRRGRVGSVFRYN
jgi:hypothetical protein